LESFAGCQFDVPVISLLRAFFMYYLDKHHTRRPVFDPGRVDVRFLVDKVAYRQVYFFIDVGFLPRQYHSASA